MERDGRSERGRKTESRSERESGRERQGGGKRLSIIGGFIGPGWACNGTGSRSIETLLRPFVGVMTLGFSIIKILSLR